MRRLPPLAAVRVFEAAARAGNFTRAAEELGMTQAAVSYQMKLLEERIGAPLFARSGRGIALTELGRRIAPQVSAGFDMLDKAFAAARSETDTVLTITASNTFATNWLAVRLGAFQLQRPGLAVRLLSSDEVVDLASSEIDVAIRTSFEPWPGMVSHFLMRSMFAPLASPTFLAEHMIHAPEDILRVPRLSAQDLWWPRWFEAATGTPISEPTTPGVRLDSQILEGNAAIAGQGIAVLNPLMWRSQLRAGLLVQPLPQVGRGRGCYRLVYSEAKRNLPKIRAFRDWMLAEIVQDAADDPWGAFVAPDGE